MTKKAQIEIIGLIFIVLIITIGMLFYVSYTVEDDINPEKSVYNIYASNELSVSFIQALLDTSVCGTNVQELIVDCAKYKKIQCDAKNSCQQLDETIISIKNATLDEWQLSYGILINMTRDNFYIYLDDEENCKPRERIIGKNAPAIQPIALYPGEAYVELGICD